MSRKDNESSPIWFTVYADMMTNLALFFLAAFVLSRVETNLQKKVNNAFRDKSAGKTPHTIVIDNATGVSTQSYSPFSQVEISETKIRITLSENVLFASGSSALSAKTRQTLHNITEMLRRTNNPVVVEGYTDNLPPRAGTNWELSLARAMSVVDYFVKEEGLPHNKFMVIGYGEYKPLTDNSSEDNRRKNRRIEITLVRYE